MNTQFYVPIGQVFNIIATFAGSLNTDTVTISIRRLSDGYYYNFTSDAFQSGSASGSMTFFADIDWKADFTPDQADTYIITCYNATLDSTDKQVVIAVGTAAAAGTTGTELTTLANLRAYLKKEAADTTDDTLLQAIITRVSAEIEKRCGRVFAAATYTEYYAGNGTNKLYLKNWPVNSITSIHIDSDREWGSDVAVDSDDIIISSKSPGLVILDGGETFLRTIDEIENVKVVYNAGYATIPSDLEQACIDLCCVRYIQTGGIINTVVKDKIDPQEIEDRVWELLERNYRAVSVC